MNALLFILLIAQTPAKPAQDLYWNIQCWDKGRIVHFLDPNSAQSATQRKTILERMTVDMVSVILPSEGRVCNRDSTRAVVPRKLSEAYELKIFNEKPYLMRVRIKNIHTVEQPRWINEHMLYIRIWTSKVAGADLYWDVENERAALLVPFLDATVAFNQAKETCGKGGAQANPACGKSKCIRLK